MYQDLLKRHNLKNTPARAQVLAVLSASAAPLSAEEIYLRNAAARQGAASPSVSTIYRTLHTLCEKGIVRKAVSPQGGFYYQIEDHAHKHHLVCEGCRQVVPIGACPLHQVEEELTRHTGYVITGHNLQFTGLCPRCAQRGKE